MESYLTLFISFVSGGGLLALLNWRLRAKSEKIDFADKAIEFEQKLNDRYMKRIEALENKIDTIAKMSCAKAVECDNRVAVM